MVSPTKQGRGDEPPKDPRMIAKEEAKERLAGRKVTR